MNISEISALETPLEMRREVVRLALKRNISEDDIWLKIEAYRKIYGNGGRPRAPASISDILRAILPPDKSKLKITESPVEDLLKYELQAREIQFETQKKIGRYRADFFFPQGKLIVETEGAELRSTRKRRLDDAKRQSVLMRRGHIVLRFTASEVFQDAVGCVNKIVGMLG